MSESEVMCTMSVQTFSNFDALINDLENESYMRSSAYFKDEVKTKIEEFSNWFSMARLYLLQLNDRQEAETYVFLLLNLRKQLKFALTEINKSLSNRMKSFVCNVCGEHVTVQPKQEFWGALQNHSHFEQSYQQCVKSKLNPSVENGAAFSTDDSTSDDTPPPAEKPRVENLNDFKFNFVIKYDPIVEESLYPDFLTSATRKIDHLQEYSVQRCGPGRAVCLLCRCSLTSGGRTNKITAFTVKNHVSGQRHLGFAQSDYHRSALSNYHDFWRGQEPALQAHQLHFAPTDSDLLSCHLCYERVAFAAVLSHIRGSAHKSRIVKLVFEGRVKDYYLLNMQGQVYGVQNEANNAKEKKKPEANGTAPQVNCQIVKFNCEDFPGCSTTELPPRYSEHQEFFTKDSDWVKCVICDEKLNGGVPVMKSHVLSTKHKKLSKLAYDTFTYFCEICQVYLKNEAEWDDHFIKGPNRHKTVSATRQLKLGEYQCKTCKTVLYGDDLSLSRHITARGVKNGRPREIKLPYQALQMFKDSQSIEEKANAATQEAKELLSHESRMNACCADLEEALSQIFPGCTAYPFGSRISGLGNEGSDLDIFMDTGDMYRGERRQDSLSQERYVKQVSKLLKSLKDDFAGVVSIPLARTPIVRLHHVATELDCDLSFRHGLGVENTKFVRFCIQLQPVTQPFILLIKKWSVFCKINEHLTNYALALMAIFYLQTEGYLLSVKRVRELNPKQSLVIDEWETLNYSMPVEQMKELVTPCTCSMKQLLRGFFSYFSKFDYANDVVCPLMGCTVPKLNFNENPNVNLPPEMASYLHRIETDDSEQFRGLSPFCIQDPFDLSHNLVKACNHGAIGKLKTMCTLTYEHLDTFE